ncbi:GNAT family N-acetyltransferase [Enterococcus sp. DIV0187]|uniref:GNAT family N-acetyltransferase n=1 Tax=Enterococcus sp. DIV0187 TaxID=2774644 RepID=UPI003F219844
MEKNAESHYSLRLVNSTEPSFKFLLDELYPILRAGLAKTDGEGILSTTALTDSNKILVIKDSEKNSICGYCAFSEYVQRQVDANLGLWQERAERSSVYIEQLFIVPGHRRKGLATKLINEVEQLYDSMYVHVSTKNTVSLLFHLNKGFEVIDWYYAKEFYGVSEYNSLFLRSSINQREE